MPTPGLWREMIASMVSAKGQNIVAVLWLVGLGLWLPHSWFLGGLWVVSLSIADTHLHLS